MTYKDLLDKIEGAGQAWSQWDLDMAKKHPEFGATMFTYKQDYAGAKDQAGKTAANQGAESLRRKYGSYLGGSDGSKYYGMGPAPGGYKSPYQDRIDGLLDKMEGYGDFDFGPAPSYTNRYQEELDDLLDQVQGYGPFAWSKEKDPAYSAYAKQYRREGERATADALAKASAMSGGQLSSAAMTAASQAGDYYAGQLADKIPELYAAAYDRYLGDYNLLADKLGQTQRAEQLEYGKYVDALGQYNQDRSQAYNEYLAGFDRLQGTLGAFQGQDGVEYDRLLDQIQYNQQQEALAQAQVDAMLQAGVMPGEGLVGQSGYDREYIQAMDSYYKQQAARPGRTGDDFDGGDDGVKMSLTTAKEYAENGIFTPEVLEVFRKNGWTEELLAAKYGYAPEEPGKSDQPGDRSFIRVPKIPDSDLAGDINLELGTLESPEKLEIAESIAGNPDAWNRLGFGPLSADKALELIRKGLITLS